MSTHLVVGAGPIGTRTSLLLADAGERVRIVTRSGGGPDHPSVEKVTADASDAPRMRRLAEGAVAVYNCANPSYTRWATDWPPIAAALLEASASSGAVLATVGNLYGYGRVSGPITHQSPLAPCDPKGEVRAQMWRDALAAHQAGRVRVVEVRASDYADAGANSHLARNAPAVLAGKTAWVLGGADATHSWTTTHDTARLLVDVAADEHAHGQAWLVPTAPPRSQREGLQDISAAAAVPAPRVRVLGPRALRAVGLFSPKVRELAGTAYQFTDPFVVDHSVTVDHVGWQPEEWSETVARVVRDARAATAGAR
jgi:nucleoside-diphosphate-sugar epimerase